MLTINFVDDFLKNNSAYELIQSFDFEFDIPFKHGLCVGLLEMFGAYEQNDHQDELKLAEYVGAWWCRIVRADVLYNLLDGLEGIKTSRADAEKLQQKILQQELNPQFSEIEREAIAYMVTRWHDGAGKIYYRCADFTEARILFEKAIELAQQNNLWYCLPDIVSNYLRADYQERLTAGGDRNIKLADAYKQLHKETINSARGREINIRENSIAELTKENLSNQQKEFLRGLASILHNWSVECQENRDASLELSHKSEEICRLLNDGYRLAQALNHQAIQASKGKDFPQVRKLYNEILGLPWVRGKLIAKQNLAKLDAQEGKLLQAAQQLIELLDGLKQQSQRRGGDLGFDIDFHKYTVEVLEQTVLNHKQLKETITAEQVQEYRQRLQEEKLQMVRSVRQVIKVSQYKTAFSKKYYPVYLQLISELIKKHSDNSIETKYNLPIEEAFSLIEEANSRELLDLLQKRTQTNSEFLNIDPLNLESAENSSISSATEIPSESNQELDLGPRRGGIRQISILDTDTTAALERRRKFYEDLSLKQPITTSQHNPEIAHEVSMFAANHPGLVIVRYFFHGNAEERQLGAYVFRRSSINYQPLDWQTVRTELVEPWAEVWNNPISRREKSEYCSRIYNLLIEPLWDLITGGQPLNQLGHLVLIPSGELFRLPLHVALVPGENMPLAASVPLSFSVSATAYLTRGRHLLRRQPFNDSDDLCALMKLDKEVTGKELSKLTWPPEHFFIAGQIPRDVCIHHHVGNANREGLARLILQKPEIFVYAGHGDYNGKFGYLGPALVLDQDCLTQFDIAMGVQLPRNKLTLLGACVSGQGADIDGGEVAGFLRAFIAAGCGVLGITLWPVLDETISGTIHHILKQASHAANSGEPLDIVQELYKYYHNQCQKIAKNKRATRIEACPLILYT